ncbi:MAG TPA: Rne/Rng family ribonuclease [Streptosporangiaceae bacterium]|nr:Rne/Rng family ribonuclease [Streptosporangiaceae bacterium]
MLETEPQNDRQSDPSEPTGGDQNAGKDSGQRRGLLRRARRSIAKPAEPTFRSGAPADSGAVEAPAQRGQRQQPGGQAAPAVPAVPGVGAPEPGGRSGSGRAGSGQKQQPVPAAAFQPPVLVFQPPELTERPAGESGPARDEWEDSAGDEAEGTGGGSRRRRRGGRGRGKGGPSEPAGQAAGALGSQGGQAQADRDQGGAGGGRGGAEGGPADDRRGDADRSEPGRQDGARSGSPADGGRGPGGDEATGEGGGSSSRRRRRRRQRNGSVPVGGEVPSPDEPADTVVHVREPRQAAESDDVRAVKGSTRLEAKRQRRREGRDTGRRRPPVISESEFLARREAVERVMVVRQHGDRTQIAVLEDGVLVEHYVDKASHQSYVGNVYLGKVQNVLPSMEAAFVDIGKGRNAVLYAGEVNFDASGLEGVAKRIESALKSGQSIMVQVTKDPIGHKGARLTSQVSLPGRYLVYVPGASMTGISRKLPDTERSRLKQILKKVAPEDGGIIVRTAAEGASEEELVHDVTRLVAQWQAIERKAKTATAPDLLYGEPDLTIRVVRDIFNEDFTKLVIASDSEWDLVDEYVRYVAPTLADRLEQWTDEKDLFAAYRIDEQLTKALDRKVWLPSGGSLVIDTTEAMTVIDVNTGKFTGQGGNLEQTVTRNNLEAAEEIVRQLRLRDIGGIIVIDFIDMVLESNRDLVLRRLIECLARDRTKHQVAEVTSLGLVQMTRKRVGTGLLAAFSVPCEHCNGRGLIISTDLTDLPAGRNGQQAAQAKPGPSRSRSARSKAIAQVAAATAAEPVAAPAAETTAVEPTQAEPADTSAQAEPADTSAQAESAGAGSAGSGSAAAEPVAAASGTDATASNGAGSADGAQPESASSRRRPRRSAHREAGPPDSVLAAAAAGARASVVTAEPSAAPALAEPAADGPATASSATDATATGGPAAEAPATGDVPTASAAAAAEPVTAELATSEPVAGEPVTGEPVTAEAGAQADADESAGSPVETTASGPAGRAAGGDEQADQPASAPEG